MLKSILENNAKQIQIFMYTWIFQLPKISGRFCFFAALVVFCFVFLEDVFGRLHIFVGVLRSFCRVR